MSRNKNTIFCAALFLSAAYTVGCHRLTGTSANANLRRIAKDLAQELIIVDTHQDLPWRLTKQTQDISRRTRTGDFDYPRARKGGLDAVFVAAYIPPEFEEKGGARALADETIDMIESWTRRWPDKFVLAKSPADVKDQFGQERVSLVMAIENGSPIESDLAGIKHFYDRGVRYITLVHSKNNHICDSSYEQEPKWNGLSPFGKELIPQMNRVGMMIDVSHASDKAFYQIIELSRAPVVATHSACRHFTPGWERNMDDEMIKLLAKNGGVIQINFGSMFVNEKVNRAFDERAKHITQYVKAHNLQGKHKEAYIGKYVRANPIADTDISDVVANIDHVVKLAGIDHVGLGSDFDGLEENLPRGLKDVSCYPNLIYELLRSGYTKDDIRRICSDNFLSVWSDVQQTAQKLQSDTQAP
jgi:membrane dipeptidase